MAKFTLDFEDDFDFKLIGIFSHVKDYRLSWGINQSLGYDLQKIENLIISSKGIVQEHSFFEFKDDENLLDYFLIANRSESGLLVPEEKCDYFFLIKGIIRDSEYSEVSTKISKIKHVLATRMLHAEELKSKENLIF